MGCMEYVGTPSWWRVEKADVSGPPAMVTFVECAKPLQQGMVSMALIFRLVLRPVSHTEDPSFHDCFEMKVPLDETGHRAAMWDPSRGTGMRHCQFNQPTPRVDRLIWWWPKFCSRLLARQSPRRFLDDVVWDEFSTPDDRAAAGGPNSLSQRRLGSRAPAQGIHTRRKPQQ